MVITALALFAMAAMMTFAIDVSHWFDYSRNLQDRADAAALAAGAAFGNSCFAGNDPGTTQSGAQSAVGKWAQLYSGAGVGEPNGNLPYTDAQVSASTTNPVGSGGPGTGWNVVANGYINNTKAGSPVNSPLTLKAGSLSSYSVRLNANDYATKSGSTNFAMGDFCHGDPTFDATDKQCFGQTHGQTSGPCAVGPMVDVKVSQSQLPNFIPIFNIHPDIGAHARVELQGEASSANLRPIAVSDPGAFSCVTVRFKDAADDTTLATTDLTETDAANFVWQSVTPISLHMPTNGDRVYMQPFLSDCKGDGQTYDDSTHSGIELVNSYGTGTPGSDQPPRITSVTVGGANFHGVTLSGSCTAPSDQYFSVGADCKVQPTAVVAFAVGKQDATVTAVDQSTGDTLDLKPDNTGQIWSPNGAGNNFLIGTSSGRHPIEIKWTQTNGTINGVTCGTGGNNKPPPCTGTFGIQAQAFGSCNGCDQPDDSGPIILSQLHLLGDLTGDNSFQQDSTQQLYVKLQLAGIRAQTGAGAPDIILRFSGSTNHQTGLVDCGQGNGPGGSSTPGDAYTIYGGCGARNPFEPPQCNNIPGVTCKLPVMNPLFVYGRGSPTDCSPAVDQDYTDWPENNHQDCVQTTPGSRRVNVVCGLLQRITGVTPADFNASSSACNSNTGIGCPANNWPNTNVAGDNRKIDVVLTAPLDLAAADGSPQFWIPIRRIATFYVTGWDESLFPKCPSNDSFPGKGKQSQNGAIWGHWISDTDTGGLPDGNPCDVNSIEPVNCVPALTR